MLHYQTRVAAIGNKANDLSKNPKCLKPTDEVRTRVRCEKRGGRHQWRRPLLLTAAPRAPFPERCRLQGRQRWDCLYGRRGFHDGIYAVGTSLRGEKFRWGREGSRGASRANPPGQSCQSCVRRKSTSAKAAQVARSLFFKDSQQRELVPTFIRVPVATLQI